MLLKAWQFKGNIGCYVYYTKKICCDTILKPESSKIPSKSKILFVFSILNQNRKKTRITYARFLNNKTNKFAENNENSMRLRDKYNYYAFFEKSQRETK